MKMNYLNNENDNFRLSTRDCPFCVVDAAQKAQCLAHVFALRDLYPVAEGHTLIVPLRHEPGADALTDDELLQTMQLARDVMCDLRERDPSILGFNCGYNIGRAAGQSVPHAHYHVIPRRAGDVEDPFGGIRGVIPSKRRY